MKHVGLLKSQIAILCSMNLALQRVRASKPVHVLAWLAGAGTVADVCAELWKHYALSRFLESSLQDKLAWIGWAFESPSHIALSAFVFYAIWVVFVATRDSKESNPAITNRNWVQGSQAFGQINAETVNIGHPLFTPSESPRKGRTPEDDYVRLVKPEIRRCAARADGSIFRESGFDEPSDVRVVLASFNSNATLSAQILYEGESSARVHGCWLNEQYSWVQCSSGRVYELILAASVDGNGHAMVDDRRRGNDPRSEVMPRELPEGNYRVTVFTSLGNVDGPTFRFDLKVGWAVEVVAR